ncbi:MAG TPA: hypothetical protein VH325_04160 [Bryobacteraceae bacterium]|jgi:photosystem II stability/assembly factor-like uncharacterized protein|nr:hypothetical protein [Bryobacteraceae bacterium]
MLNALILNVAFLAGGILSWQVQDSHTTASLRGLSVQGTEIWTSGTGGTYLQSSDAGATWRAAQVPGAANLDFRAVAAIGGRVYLVSSGPGEQSRIYMSPDAGQTWTLQFTNNEPQGFFDAVAFWDAQHGIVLGDPINGHWDIATTSDGGEHWTRQAGPTAQQDEGAFAASGTCLIVRGKADAWFATGGKGGARVMHSIDGGQTWTTASAPIRHDGPGAGIFSIAFRDDLHGIIVGGDYGKPAEDEGNVAITSDGGRTWRSTGGVRPHGYRSAAIYWDAQKAWLVVGISGSDISLDDGQNWQQFDSRNLNSAGVSGGVAVGVGPKGVVATIQERYTQR